MNLPKKFKLPILQWNNVCYSCNLQNKTYSGRRKISFGRPDMHLPVIEVNLHNVSSYQKQRLFSFNCKCLQKLIMWLIQRDEKQITNILIDKKGFHSVIFVLDEGNCPSPMLVSRMTNSPKCTTRLCLSTAKFFRAAAETFTQYNIEYGLLENVSFNFKFNVPVGFWRYWN